MSETYLPRGVIPANLLPMHADLSIDESSYRKHLRDLADVRGVTAITTNAHASEVASLTREEQRRIIAIAIDEVGSRPAVVDVAARLPIAILESTVIHTFVVHMCRRGRCAQKHAEHKPRALHDMRSGLAGTHARKLDELPGCRRFADRDLDEHRPRLFQPAAERDA